MNITICPPMPAHGTPRDEFAFGIRKPHPVEVHSNGNGSFTSTGLSFDDASRMNISQRKRVGERRKGTPAWALNNDQTQEVIARYVEVRSGLRFPHSGTPRERIARAEAWLAAQEVKSVQTLTKLNREYMVTESPERKRQLAQKLEELDTTIHINRTAAALAAGIVYLYHRGTCDSVGVGAELGIKPTAIRQILYRMSACAEGLSGNGRPMKRKTTAETCLCDECIANRPAESVKPKKPRTPRPNSVVRLCPCGQPAPSRCKYCEACAVVRMIPRHCTVCGALCPKGHRTLCGSAACKKKVVRDYNQKWYNTKRKRARKPRVFCSPVCEEVAKHAPVVVSVMSSFGVTYEEAQRSSTGSESYETYVAFAVRSGVSPMPMERWATFQ